MTGFLNIGNTTVAVSNFLSFNVIAFTSVKYADICLLFSLIDESLSKSKSIVTINGLKSPPPSQFNGI
jgi:hypothetical protein